MESSKSSSITTITEPSTQNQGQMLVLCLKTKFSAKIAMNEHFQELMDNVGNVIQQNFKKIFELASNVEDPVSFLKYILMKLIQKEVDKLAERYRSELDPSDLERCKKFFEEEEEKMEEERKKIEKDPQNQVKLFMLKKKINFQFLSKQFKIFFKKR